ncbi:MAG: hypothetical protein HYV34_00550 [Candidatus Kerfeldbacteria bacterium]|nr:hypothetical protein [Candidatus Kerfeldbacteria bacterium]
MIRTQIYLPQDLHRQLTTLARGRNTSLAGVIRNFVQHGLQQELDVDHTGKKALLSLLEIKAKGGPKDLSTNLDHYLYGGPKRKGT